jgi:hypothetical protein
MINVLKEAFIDSLEIVPLLFVIYLIIEYVEMRWGNKMRENVEKAGLAGPAIGAIAGSLPQCGFSVITSALYTQRLVTIGTLIAVFIATSDEAIPIILSQPSKIYTILPIISFKILIALIAGYGLDLFFRHKSAKVLNHIEQHEEGKCAPSHRHEKIVEEKACCGHTYSPKKIDFKELLLHPLVHTVKIFFFIFLITLALDLTIYFVGDNSFRLFFAHNYYLQPLIAGVIGLIPSCASSVVITELFLSNTISYGAVIAGLSSGGGLGILVLMRENKNKKETVLIIGLLLSISIIAGYIALLFS